MNNWIETELSSIIELTNGYAFKSKDFKDSGIPVIKIKNVKPQEIKLNVLSYVDKETIIGKEKWKINKGDILITMSGNRSDGSPDSWVGKVAQFNKEGEYYLNQRLSILKPKVDYVNSTFLAYQLSSWDYQLELINLSNSSGGQANISPEIVKQLKILLPTLLEQEQIAEILSSLDDKIELLHKNNKTFEQLAETLFRQWFVEEVKEEWNEVKLGSHISLVSGYSYRSVDLNNSTKALVTLKNFDRNGGFRHDGFKEYTGKYKGDQVVVSGDLIVAHTDITQEAEVLGNPAIVISSSKYETLIISTDLVKVVPTSYLSKAYIYFLMKTDDFKHYCLGNSNGTTVLHLSKKALPGYDIKLPPSLLVEKFTEIAEPLLEKMNTNQKHIQKLETLRDTLLPKLMSGTVRVEN
jgi:type I restriction enzyme S subunit